MIVIFENGKITGVEKGLLNLLNIEFENLSGFLTLLNTQLSAINGSKMEINGSYFNVNEIELLSFKNIKAFELTPSEKTSQNEFETNLDKTLQNLEVPKFEEESISPAKEEIENLLMPEHITYEEPNINIHEDSREDEFDLSLEKENLLKAADTSEIQSIKIPEIEETKEEVPDVLDNLDVKAEEPQETEQKPVHDKLINTEEEKILQIDEDIFAEKETAFETTPTKEDEVIELTFEDDLDEIRKILNMSKEEFNQSIISELKKASEELGIEYKMLTEWFYQLIDQIKDEKNIIYKNLTLKKYDALHESYHKLKGAALNLRLSKIALVLKKLDELSKKHENISKIQQVTDDFYSLIENQDVDLTQNTQPEPVDILSFQKEEKPANEPKKYIQSIILKTIQSYLNTQNEAQFQKDKKYIEKILNTKIDSIEDLQNIIKGME